MLYCTQFGEAAAKDLAVVFGIGLRLVGTLQNIVGGGAEIICQTDQRFQGQLPLSVLILGICVLTDAEIRGQFLLCDVMIFPNVF